VADVTQVESGGGIQVDDPPIVRQGANPRLPDSILKGHESHEKRNSRMAIANLKSLLPAPSVVHRSCDHAALPTMASGSADYFRGGWSGSFTFSEKLLG
jgi:hypothetical protein